MWSFSLTQPHVDIVGWSRSGVKENIGISSEEVSKQLFGDRFQIIFSILQICRPGSLPAFWNSLWKTMIPGTYKNTGAEL